MRAVGLFTHGGPEVLQVVELPEVHAGPGQVRIRVHAATVNPTDVGVRNSTRPNSRRLIRRLTCQEWRRRASSTRLEATFPTDSSWRRRHGDRGAERQPWRVSRANCP